MEKLKLWIYSIIPFINSHINSCQLEWTATCDHACDKKENLILFVETILWHKQGENKVLSKI